MLAWLSITALGTVLLECSGIFKKRVFVCELDSWMKDCFESWDGKCNRGSFGTMAHIRCTVLVITQSILREEVLFVGVAFCGWKKNVWRTFHTRRSYFTFWKFSLWVVDGWKWGHLLQTEEKLKNTNLSNSLLGATHSKNPHSLQTWVGKGKNILRDKLC